MRLNKILLIIGFVTYCFFNSVNPVSAMSFSADFYGSEGQSGKIYIDSSKTRMETNEMISITRYDKMLVWLLMPEEKMYMEQSLNPVEINQEHLPSNQTVPDEIERVFISHETINGYASDKYKITINNQGSHYEWISSDPGLTMSVKTAAIDGSWWNEYRNISLAAPDPSLFEVPSGYTKMNMPPIAG
ncbi:MAG: DUF4412 domain-containing protein [Acidaminococcaceae bacterium]